MNLNIVIDDLEKKLKKVVTSFEEVIKAIPTGKPTYEQISNIEVEAYGSKMIMASVATFTFESPAVVLVNIFDKSIKNEIYKALENADLGVSIQDNGGNLRLTFRQLTEEDKKERIKKLGDVTESFKVKVRLLRQEANSSVKADSAVREDEKNSLLEIIQKKIDGVVEKIDEMSNTKKSQILG